MEAVCRSPCRTLLSLLRFTHSPLNPPAAWTTSPRHRIPQRLVLKRTSRWRTLRRTLEIVGTGPHRGRWLCYKRVGLKADGDTGSLLGLGHFCVRGCRTCECGNSRTIDCTTDLTGGDRCVSQAAWVARQAVPPPPPERPSRPIDSLRREPKSTADQMMHHQAYIGQFCAWMAYHAPLGALLAPPPHFPTFLPHKFCTFTTSSIQRLSM